jgi:VWFA-related protein
VARTLSTALGIWLGLTLTLTLTLAQERPPQPQTTFKTGVDLVPVDVNVIDRDGRPVDGLTAASFTLAVDGKPRRIATAEFVQFAASSASSAPSTYFSSNENASSGRLIALVIDQGNISAGRARGATESAIRFIKRLSPADRIGLFVIPGPGAQIPFTSNHALILSQIPRIVGQATDSISPQRMGLGEALRIERGDQIALGTVTDRECATTDRLVCQQELAAESRELVNATRDRTLNSLGTLRALMEQLAANSAPKTLVYLSEALVIDQNHSELAWVGPLASKGQIALHVLRIDTPSADASQRRSFNRSEDAAAAEEGLTLLAGLTRGSFFRVAGNADGIFNRLALEMSGYYLLGFEPEPGDRDGRPHKIKIEVPGRRGIEVRARQDFAIEAPRVLSDEEVLAETLQSPLIVSDIGLKATAYTFRDDASRKLRILIAADIDRSQNPAGRIALGYALLDGSGRIVSSHFERQLNTPVNAERSIQRFVTAAEGDAPGIYGLKLAVVDSAGKRGSVQHAFRAQLTQAGEVRAADLLIGETAMAGETGPAPAVAGDFTDADSLHGYLELYSDSAEVLKTAAVVLEIAAKEDSRALESAPALVDERGGNTSRRVVEGVLPIALLPPGEYHVRAVISVDGRKLGQVIRPFRITRSAVAAAAPAPGRGRARGTPAGPFTVRVDPFQRATVLTPQVVGFFVDRMSAGGKTPAPPDVIDDVRAGRLDRALEAARGSGHALATAFLQGISLYARGDFEAAAVKFRESFKLDSEFFAAAFYLGACYAANGRDRDASAAWQTSLVSETDAPFIYTLLADSLLRQRELDQALEVLNDATARWPDNPEIQKGLGTALAMSGKASEASHVLDTYLEKHPEDTERLFLALRIIVDAHASGRSVDTPEQDRARFGRYAAAYAAAAGPQLAMVEQWKKFMARPR